MKLFDNLKILKFPKNNKNYLVTIAIGKEYYDNWASRALPLWKEYCKKNNLGIIVFYKDLIPKNHIAWKKPTWQKLLIGSTLKEKKIDISNICYLDTDILINPYAPNIFDYYKSTKIGVVSIKKNLPYPIDDVLRRVSFLRNRHYYKKYPLDSAIFKSIENIFKFHKLPKQDDFFCAGLFLFNLLNHSNMMKKIFHKYPSNIKSITNGGDQTHLNFEFQTSADILWLDYRFQSIWVYEMAWKYPFLYTNKKNSRLISQCIEASLYQNYFLHFAGSWYESDMWKIGNFFNEANKKEEIKKYYTYLKTKVTGREKGTINPKSIKLSR